MKSIKTLHDKYYKYSRRLASKYANAYKQFEVDDLLQTAMLAISETAELLDDTKSVQEHDYFFKQHIKWAILSYIFSNYCDVKGNKNSFFEGNMCDNADECEIDVVMSGMNPEDLYILFEDRAVLDEIIRKFEDTLTDRNDMYVWFKIMKTDEPYTTREMAHYLGVSPKTITNIRRRLEERFHELYTGGE
jgi:hypothetical protein